MTAATLRADAVAMNDHARRCDEVADRLAARNAAMAGLLDQVVLLHVPSTWDSPTATERRRALAARRDSFEAVRTDLTSLVRQLRARAEVDHSDARDFIRRAEQLEDAARRSAIEAHDRLTLTGPR